jgi:hypothetical protein
MKREILEKIIKESRTYTETLRKLGLRAAGGNFKTLKKNIEKYELDITHFDSSNVRKEKLSDYRTLFMKKDLSDYLIENSTYSRTHLKKRLYCEGFKEKKCELCGQDEIWNGNKMSLILDHINGVWDDNRIENLRIVCPNCNATLDTHCGKQKNKYKKDEYRKMISEGKIQHYLSKRKVDRPEYQLLIKEIDEIGYSATGRKYGVSDNSIRKWVKSYEKLKVCGF